jgi:integrase
VRSQLIEAGSERKSWDAAGKRRQKWHTVRGGKKDAERELTRLLHEINIGAYVEPSRMSLSDYLDRWLEHYARPSVSAKTFERYEEIIRLHLKPALGYHPLSKPQPLHIARYYAEALVSGRKDGGGGLSARSVLHHHRVLHSALRQAVKWLLLSRNPADAVDPPRPRLREMRALDEFATAKLLRAASESRLSLPVLLAVTTGLRRGEILGLRWQDVALEDNSLAVRQSLEQTRSRLALKQPKTAQGRRVIALPSLATEALRQHKIKQAAIKLSLGAAYQDNDLVCAREDGTPWPPDAFLDGFRGTCQEGRSPESAIPRPAAYARDTAPPTRGASKGRKRTPRPLHRGDHAGRLFARAPRDAGRSCRKVGCGSSYSSRGR